MSRTLSPSSKQPYGVARVIAVWQLARSSYYADKSGSGLGLPILVALCGSLLGKNTRGGTIIMGALNLGGSIEMIPNAVRVAELAIDKQAQTLLMPVAARRQ